MSNKSLTFYEEVIGFKVLTTEPNKVTLTADGSTPLLVLEEQDDSVERPFPHDRTLSFCHS